MLMSHVAMVLLVFAIVLWATGRPTSFWTWVARQRWTVAEVRELLTEALS